MATAANNHPKWNFRARLILTRDSSFQTQQPDQTRTKVPMKTQIMQRITFTLAAAAAMAIGGAARADISTNGASTTIAWPTASSPLIYSSTSFASLTADGQPGAAAGALATSLAETFTITNSAGTNNNGVFIAGPGTGTNYQLTGIAIVITGGNSVPCTLHLYDVTTNLTSNNGSTLNGSGASYNQISPATVGDLLGQGAGLTFLNNHFSAGTEQVLYLGLQNGPNTYGDQVVLASNHTYSLEISTPTAAATSGAGSLSWEKNSVADAGGQGMGSTNFAPNISRITLTSLGQVGGAPRTFAIALYGNAITNAQTNALDSRIFYPLAVSANGSTNTTGITNYWIDQFNALSVEPGNPYYTNGANPTGIDYSPNTTGTSQIGTIWGEWFSIPLTITWDNTNDAQGNTNGGLGGSMYVQGNFGSQATLFNMYTTVNPPLNGAALGLTALEFDIKFDGVNSQPATNAAGLLNYGTLNPGTRTANAGPAGNAYGQDYFGATIAIPASVSNQWLHIKVPINPNSDTYLAEITDVLIHQPGQYGTPAFTSATGLQLNFWVDNVKFTAPAVLPQTPPSALQITKAIPGTARFFTTGPQYTRVDLVSVDTSQAWVGSVSDTYNMSTPFTSPVSYSFTLASTLPPDPNMQVMIFLIPNDTGGGNQGDYGKPTSLWLSINGRAGTTGVTGQVAWKANDANANPTNAALTFTNATAQGTWTLTFTGETNGTLLAPGWTTVSNFTVNDPNIQADFLNPVSVEFVTEFNGAAGFGEYVDWSSVSVTNVSGVNELDVFANDTTNGGINTTLWTTSFDNTTPTGYYQVTNTNTLALTTFPANAATSIIIVSNSPAFWVSWVTTTNGYGLSESANGTLPMPYTNLISPASFNGYAGPPPQLVVGATNWALITTNFMPAPVKGKTRQAYFELVNPPPGY
jgi:hypothetical protein